MNEIEKVIKMIIKNHNDLLAILANKYDIDVKKLMEENAD